MRREERLAMGGTNQSLLLEHRKQRRQPRGMDGARSLSVSDASVVIASIEGASFLVKERSRQERGADE
jgi:hypothetical protein